VTDPKLAEIKELIKESLEADQDKALRIVFVGHVDHGKSTLVGRLLHETDSILPSKIQYVEEICRERGRKFEYAFLLDALEEEQDQNVTIDVSQVLFRTKKRTYRVIDAPGHKEFLKNMISGASSADAAILLIDAEEGLKEQTRRHATILSLLGIKSIIVVVNKMDLVGYREEVFHEIRNGYSKHLESLGMKPVAYIPISAYVGDNLVVRTSQMPWYAGPTLLETLDGLEHHRTAASKPLRLPLQDVYKFDKERILAGRIESGSVSAGDELLFLPSGKTERVKSIVKWSAPVQKKAEAGESVGIILEEQIFVERGEVAVPPKARPRTETTLHANVFWLGDRHLEAGKTYIAKLTTQELECTVKRIHRVINSSTLEEAASGPHQAAKNEVAEVELEFKKPVVFDYFQDIEPTGRFVLVDGRKVSGGGIIVARSGER
jgi:sulfate adenylyltransferase large subunit